MKFFVIKCMFAICTIQRQPEPYRKYLFNSYTFLLSRCAYLHWTCLTTNTRASSKRLLNGEQTFQFNSVQVHNSKKLMKETHITHTDSCSSGKIKYGRVFSLHLRYALNSNRKCFQIINTQSAISTNQFDYSILCSIY